MYHEYNSAMSDEKSREVILNWMRSLGYTVSEGSQFGVDIMMTSGVELERRTIWQDGEFPFPTIHIPYRKKHILEKPGNKYIVLNNDYTQCMVIESKDVTNCDVIGINTRADQETNNEPFYDVPIARFRRFRIGS